MSYREVNLGNIFNGKSSYELAVEHEKFIGTEEQYVEKEQKAYADDGIVYRPVEQTLGRTAFSV